MERKMYKELKMWKESQGRKPLILQGARQTGKTYSVLEFGKRYYQNVVYVNFEGNRDVAAIFERDLNPERIVKELSVRFSEAIIPHQTLLFFDEIQSCERALTSLKYFYENAPDYHIVAAGSLLGVAVNREQYSFPVGKVELKTMYPLDFEEFLWALNKHEMVNMIRECFESNSPFSLHEEAMDLYKIYLFIGGMPEVVSKYCSNKDVNLVISTQKNINDSYVADMAKYATPAETSRIMAVFTSIPAQLAKENKKFQYQKVKSGGRAKDFEPAIHWLSDAGIILKCFKVTEGKLPLSVYAEYSYFKAYKFDTGLLCAKFNIPPNIILHGNDSFNHFKGALTENYVAGALRTNGYELYYWESDGRAEIDFIIQDKEGNIIPIEVKAAENVRAKSLTQFKGRYDIPYAIRVSGKNFGFENDIKSVPLYAVFCI